MTDSRTFDALSERWTRLAGLTPGPVPVESYRSQEFFERERERVFRRAWLVMARTEELPNPHSFILKDVEVCDVQVLITRDGEDDIQAFHNVCSHRAIQLVSQTEGCNRLLQCPYHGWTYGSDGSLRGVPDEKCFAALDKPNAGLTKIHTRLWHGWIFINLEKEPSLSLEDFLGDFGLFLADMDYPNADNPIVVEARVDCNWKVWL